MKVLLVNSEPVDYTIAFANGLAPHVETEAILPRARYETLREWIDPRVRVHLVDWPRNRSLGNPAFLVELTRRIHASGADVVHLLSNNAPWLNAAVPFWRGPVLVTTVHDIALHPGDRESARLPGWGARLLARQSDHLIVHGATLQRAASGAFRKPMDRVHILPHPAIRRYADMARALGLTRTRPAEEFVVLLFGRIFAYKGLETLIRAEVALGEAVPGLRIVIAGRGDDPRALSHLMARPERYEIRHGFVEDRDTAQLFTDADLVVLPYDEASQSGVLHVAATFGKPLVVTDVGELRATVEPNRIGLSVPPRAPYALAQAIVRLAGDPSLRDELGRNALRWSGTANAACTIGASAVALYRDMMGREDNPSSKRMPPPAEGPDCPAGAVSR